jgi:thiol:disulfide interchange protein
MLVDFTADWCAIYKTNERRALNTKRTAEFVRENGIVTFVADWTDENDEIRTWLKNFGQESVPLTVIVPADRKAKLITLSGLYSEDDLLKKLAEAMKGSDSTAAANRDGSPLSVAASETDGAE